MLRFVPKFVLRWLVSNILLPVLAQKLKVREDQLLGLLEAARRRVFLSLDSASPEGQSPDGEAPGDLPGGWLAIPKALIQKRLEDIGGVLEESRIPGDAAAILAMRLLHNQLISRNVEANWPYDRDRPSDLPVH